MQIAKNSNVAKIVAVGIGLAMAFSLSFAVPANAQTVDDLTAQINSLLSTIASLQSQLASMTGGGSSSSASVCPYVWSTNLTTGSTGADVMALQKLLNSDPATQLGTTGAGSPGLETSYFGSITAAGVAKMQNKYAAEVLTPVGLSAGTGYFGPSTRAKANALCASAPVTPVDPVDPEEPETPSVGTGVTVGAASQPANSIAPKGAARVPFTSFTLTAGSDGPVTVNSITVERTGFADNNVFSGVVLIGPNGAQVGDAKTLNSNNQAKVGSTWTIPAGQSGTYTIAGNRASGSLGKDGQVASLSVVAINTSATVSGSLPITGASHVINESLGIGTVQASLGPQDRNSASLTEEVGKVGQVFAAVRLTNTGSNEDVRVKSVRFEQVGSASNSDLENVTLTIDGVTYQAVISGDFYFFSLGSGVVINEGFNKELVLKGDIPSGSGKTVQFDIDKNTDIHVEGMTYGFGISVTADSTGAVTDASEFGTGGSPFFSASKITVSAGRVTNISKATSVAAQNISVNVPGQVLGGFDVEVKGENITVQAMTFRLGVTSVTADGADLTNVSLVDQNGAVVAGPADVASTGVLTFSDTVTLKVGKNTFTLKGRVGSDFANDDTVQASTTPLTDWTSAEGEDTGDNVTLPSGTVTGNAVTVKAASTAVNVSTSPSAQTVVAGASQFTVANIQFDGSSSGEDVRFSTASLAYTDGGTDPTNCRAYNGSTQLTDDTVNPSGTGNKTFVFDENLIVPKGTIVTVAIKCDIPGGASGTFSFGLSAAITGTGLQSGNSVSASVTANAGPTMTLASAGTLAITLDSSSPSYKLAAAGTNEVTVTVLNLRASNEDIDLDKIAVQLASTTASDSGDLGTINLYNGSTWVGSGTITGTATGTTVTLAENLIIPKDTDLDLTIKINLSHIGPSDPGQAGALVGIDFNGDPVTSTDNRAVGVASGATVVITGSDTASNGVRIFNSVPTVTKLDTTGALVNGSDRNLLRFMITADAAGDVGIHKLSIKVATSGTAVVSGINIFAYTDAGFSSPVSAVQSDGRMQSSDASHTDSNTEINFIAQTQALASTTIQVPAGQSRYFAVRGDMTGVSDSGDAVTTTLLGDAAAPAVVLYVGMAATIDGDTNDNFIWSGNSNGQSGPNAVDFSNGYQVTGLPTNGIDDTRSGS